MICNVRNVIFVITGRGCNQDYIAETGDYLRKRVLVHTQQIREPRTKMLKVNAHLDSCARELIPKYSRTSMARTPFGP